MQNDLLENLKVNSISEFFSSTKNILEENETDYILIDNFLIKNEKINGYVELFVAESLSDAEWHLEAHFGDKDEVYFFIEKTEEKSFTVFFFEKGEKGKVAFFCTGFTPAELLKEQLLTSGSPFLQMDYKEEEISETIEVKDEIIIEAETSKNSSFKNIEEVRNNFPVLVKEENKEKETEEKQQAEKGLIVLADMSILSAIFWILSLVFIKVSVALLKIIKFVALLLLELCGKGLKSACLKIASKL